MSGVFVWYSVMIILCVSLTLLPKNKAVNEAFSSCRDLRKIYKIFVAALKITIVLLTSLIIFYIFFKQIRVVLLKLLSDEAMEYIREILYFVLETDSVKIALTLCIAYVCSASALAVIVLGLLTAVSLTCVIMRLVKPCAVANIVGQKAKFGYAKTNRIAVCGYKYIKILSQLRL